jgi:hypothetical protein
MKKLISILLIGVVFACSIAAQSTTPRFGTTGNVDNTGRALNWKYITTTPTSSTATLTQNPNAYTTIIKIGPLRHALSDSLSATKAYVGDEVIFLFESDTLTAGRVVTFNSNAIKSAGTLTVTKSKKATVTFIFDGVIWIEKSRAINTN